MAMGITRRIAASTQSRIEPGPVWAALAIQRVPTMQAIAKSEISRRPSSRRSSDIFGGLENDARAGYGRFGLDQLRDVDGLYVEAFAAQDLFSVREGSGHQDR